MVDAADIHADDLVLEIGPGKGALTEKLVPLAGKVIAIEKDRELLPLLQDKFSDAVTTGRLEILERDILEFDETVLREYGKNYKLVANIPYYITGAIIRKFLESDFQPASMTLLVQKEVAERIVARDQKESILSISVKAYGTPKIIGKVPKRYFTPEPKVDSAIIYIEGISKANFEKVTEESFFRVVRTGFSHKRKLLANNLEGLGLDKTFILSALETFNLPPKTRAEDVSLSTWLSLSEYLSKEV